jgi:hypothetical protein
MDSEGGIREEEGELREGELRALKDGQKICLAVYTSGGPPDATVIYTYSALTGKMTPTGNPLGVVPDGTTNYRFVAYSFYGDPTNPPYESAIDPIKDLVWGMEDKTVTDTESDRTVHITMKHLFARVRVRIDASAIADEITDFDDVMIEGKKEANLAYPWVGVLSAGSDLAAMDVTGSLAAVDDVTLESGYQVFYPLTIITYPSPSAKVTIGSIELTIEGVLGRTFTDLSTQFFHYAGLQAGKNYTLLVALKENRWAHSNIYWNDSELTFDKKRTNPSHADYQGIFFKWGSLVGISPTDMDARLYIPDDIALKTWDDSKTLDSNDTPWASAGYNNIPFTVNPGSPAGDDENYLYDNSDFSNYKGDICRYLGGDDWRIPNNLEFWNPMLPAASYSFTAGSDPDEASGRGLMGGAGITHNIYGSAFLPASGMVTSYGVSFVGGVGRYWVGTRGGGADEYQGAGFGSGGGSINFSGTSPDPEGYSVRCIKN